MSGGDIRYSRQYYNSAPDADGSREIVLGKGDAPRVPHVNAMPDASIGFWGPGFSTKGRPCDWGTLYPLRLNAVSGKSTAPDNTYSRHSEGLED